MSSWAKPGVKCVCVLQAIGGLGGEVFPTVGQIYTVRSVHRDGDSIHLVEIRNAPRIYEGGTDECWFMLEGFRPLVTRTQDQDVALFTHLLDGLPVGETA